MIVIGLSPIGLDSVVGPDDIEAIESPILVVGLSEIGERRSVGAAEISTSGNLSDSQLLYIRGFNSLSDDQTAFVHGFNNLSDNQIGFIHGLSTISGTKALFVYGADIISDFQNAYIYSAVSAEGSQLAHIRAFINEFDPFINMKAYIQGHATSFNISDSQSAYISFIINQLTASKGITVVSPAIIMRLLTKDGNADPNTNILDDSASINNDGRILNMPVWIEGPYQAPAPVTPPPPPPSSQAYRQLGVYKGGFPASGNGAFTAFQTQLLGGATVRISETFVGRSFSAIKTGDGIYPAWKSWLDQGNRNMVHSVAMIPHYGPDGTWATKKGTDAEVSAALANGAAGTYDSHWVAFAQNIVAAGLGSAIIRLGWEFNGGWYAWRAGANPTAWVAYWKRIVDIIRTYAPNILIDWNASGSTNSFFIRNGSGTNVGTLESVYPGNSYVDIIGVDMYDQHASRTKVNAWNQVTSPALENWRVMAINKGKPLSIPEWGTWSAERNTVDADNDYYIKKMHEFIEANNVIYHMYFDVTADDGDHRITTPTAFPQAAAAFKALTWRTSRV